MTSYLLQQIVNGVQLGSVYALIALGYTMVYGIIRLINFAHADIFMVGAYIALFVVSFYAGTSATLDPNVWVWISLIAGYVLWTWISEGVPPVRSALTALDRAIAFASGRAAALPLRAGRWALALLSIVLLSALLYPVLSALTRIVFSQNLGGLLLPAIAFYVAGVCGLVGVAMERIAYRPLRHKPRLSVLITALGVSLFLENFCSLDIAFSNRYQPFPAIIPKTEVIRLEGLDIGIGNFFFVNIAVLAVLLAILWFVVEKTLVGKQMRAVAIYKKAAALMGIDVDRIIAVTFFIGPALAGVSGILYAMNYGILQSPFLGFFPGIKAFVAAVVGGIGSLPGAVIGALALGIIEVFAMSVDSNLGFAAAFAVLIVILLVRPNGIMGRKDIEKV